MEKLKELFYCFLINILPYCLGLPLGLYILWEVLIKPIIAVVTLGDIIVGALIIVMLVLACMISDGIVELLFMCFDIENENDEY